MTTARRLVTVKAIILLIYIRYCVYVCVNVRTLEPWDLHFYHPIDEVNNDISDNNKQIDQMVFYMCIYNIYLFIYIIMRPRVLHHPVDGISQVHLYYIIIYNLAHVGGRETNYPLQYSIYL
jgi:hypothetical protein